ncbi:putative ribosome biogenesis protein urb1 protein [Zalerion maritima]|uniref:Ribosome biogenesis protein urb1 protein n=1 Tax=Zalerion maritima TaxID=339359 RepID=A0AAD5RMV3_9PEZI|nr:putative ribosome biogenesis protein urb1 protein [Zalerion maritima]
MADPPPKRRKIAHEASPTSEEVYTSRQLQQLLTFNHQDFRGARHGLTSFKNFLEPFVNDVSEGSEQANLSERKTILNEYLEAVKPWDEDDGDAGCLNDITQMWAAACQVNNDNVMSAAAIALSLLLKVISSVLELRKHGLRICRSLLQKRELLSIARNLSAEKGKEFIISPTLRLVREMLCFDGGELAEDVFRARSFTFKAMGRNMGIRYRGDGLENPKRPSARTTATRLFLSALKFVNSEARQELLSQKDMVTALFTGIKDDPPYLIYEILESLQTYVLGDSKLPGPIKLKVFNAYTLPRIAILYSYNYDAKGEDEDATVSAVAHRFLLQLCSPEPSGILRPNSGFYPPGVDPDNANTAASWRQKFDGEIPVRHSVLLGLSQGLKPWANLKHSELLLHMFRAAPELVAPYFRLKEAFTFDPKLSSTWIGFSALIFSSIQLPIPPFFGHTKPKCAKVPPPTSIVLDNLVPPSLTQQAVTKCLAQQQSNLIPFFAIRLLIIAFQKLERVVKLYRATGSAEWKNEISLLRTRFERRVPSAKDVLKSYLSVPQANLLHREAASRLLHLYCHNLTSAENSSLDVSRPLLEVIKGLEDEQATSQGEALSRMELDNLVAVADASFSIRWFSKAGGRKTSLFTSLLRLSLNAPSESLSRRLLSSLLKVAKTYHLIDHTQGLSTFTSLYRALESLGEEKTDDVWSFLDNCVTRLGNDMNLKYFTMAIELGKDDDTQSTEGCVSKMTACLHEQFLFVAKSGTEESLAAVTKLLAVYIGHVRTGQNTKQLDFVVKSMTDAMPPKFRAAKALKKVKDSTPPCLLENLVDDRKVADQNAFAEEGWTSSTTNIHHMNLDDLLCLDPLVELDNSALTRWANKPVEKLVHDGHIRALVMLLTSEHSSIRLEAAVNIVKLASKIKQAKSYLPHLQLWLVLMELAETVTPNLAQEPALGIFVSFAAHSLTILTKPLHPIYPALNKFLCAAPRWQSNRLPFISHFLDGDSETEGSFYAGFVWIFKFLADGIRSPRDIALFFNDRTPVERLLTDSWSHPNTQEGVRFAALGMLKRVADVEGGKGADLLVSKLAIPPWLAIMEVRAQEEEKEKEELACRLLRGKIMSRARGLQSTQ